MQKATASSPQPRQPFAGLFIGGPGSGKTTFAIQFPRLYIADVDLNMDGPLRRLKKLNPAFEYHYDMIPFRDDQKTPVPVEDQWERLEECVAVALKTPNDVISTVMIDGLTHVNNILMRYVCKKAGKADMDISLWIPFKQRLWSLLVRCRSAGKNTIMVCHEEYQYSTDKKDIMQKTLIKRSPAVNSGITDYFGAFFTDTWRFESRPGVKGPTFWLQLTKTAYDDLKNSYGETGEVDITEGGFAKVNQVLKLS